MLKKVKKFLASLIILLLSLGPLIGPLTVYAEEPEPSPAPPPAAAVTNEATVTNDTSSTAISGENTITTPSPEPSASPEMSASPDPSPSPSTELGIVDPLTELGIVDPSPSPSPDTQITTGDTLAVTEIDNSVNTTQINSNVIYKTLNIFLDGDINLADSGTLQTIIEQALAENPDETTLSVSYDGINVARVENEVVSIADSGNNTIDGGQEAVINTGNSYSIVSLLNQVNTTIIDSQIYLVTINIFGNVSANIILPELTAGSGSNQSTPCCDTPVNISNQAIVNNQVDSQAVSGQNTIVAMTDAVIETGEVNSSVNVVNLVNTTLINANIRQLVINILGSWLGDWLGADKWLTQDTATNDETGCDGCVNDITISNQAQVDNQIISQANSGGNSINAESGQIKTGNAYSSVSLFNLINTSIINSTGFWGFINIFGSLTGNIGTAADLFPEPTPTPTPTPEPEITASTGPEVRETGGQLGITQSNNVGEYILPGDTVTFSIFVKNPGGGRVYDTKLWLGLVKDGENMGGSYINLGNIDAHKGIKISTGLAISNLADAGKYIAVAEVSGLTGPTNEAVAASADSNFLIAAFSPLINGLATPVQASGTENVLGETIAAGVTPYNWLLKLFWLLLLLLAVLKAIEKREQLGYAWAKNKNFLTAKAMAIRSLLFSLLALIKSS